MKVNSGFFSGTSIKTTRPMVILFYSNNCGHCHDLMPTWQRFAHDTSMPTAALELSTANQNLVKALTQSIVKGVPSIFIYREGRPYKEYKGNRSYDSLMNFAANDGNINFEKVGR